MSRTIGWNLQRNVAVLVLSIGVGAGHAQDGGDLTPQGEISGYSVTRDIAYGEDPQQILDLYVPDGAGRMTVVFLHGGGYYVGDKSEASRYLAPCNSSRSC